MEKLRNEAEKIGISLNDKQIEQFKIYMDMLLSYNENINLTAITDKDEVILKHFVDSITLIQSQKLGEGVSMIDIGAGAGFPSLPVKIARTDIKVTMLDSLNKRICFLEDVISSLGLKDIDAVHLRAEDGGRTELREAFDIATARAVANLAVLAEYALPFVKVGGYFLAMKGSAPEDEINAAKPAIKELGGKIESVMDISIDNGEINHSIVIIKKILKTPSKYPRKAGKPVKEPIK